MAAAAAATRVVRLYRSWNFSNVQLHNSPEFTERTKDVESHKEAIHGFWQPQFVVAEGHNELTDPRNENHRKYSTSF